MVTKHNINKLTLNQMLQKLNDMYDREEEMVKEFKKLQEDKELIQTMIMYAVNRMEDE